jgi:hypothetical protein
MRAAAVALGFAALLAAAPAAAVAAPPCPPAGAEVVKRSRAAVVYAEANRYRACLRAGGPHRTLGAASSLSRRPLALAGRFVALERDDGCSHSCVPVAVIDLRTGRRRWSGAPREPHQPEPVVRRIVVDGRGRSAYVRDLGTTRELRQLDADGDDRLDSGAGIAPRSLRLAGGRVHWTNGGAARSARFDTRPPCALRRSVTVERGQRVRVYRADGAYWACFAPTGLRTQLMQVPDDDFEYYGGGFIRVAGRFATIDDGYAGRGGGSADLQVWNVEAGRIHRRWRCCEDGGGAIDAVVLAPTGAVAWTNGRREAGTGWLEEVRKSDADGEAIVLDQAPWRTGGLDVRSLALHGTTISWVHSGETRTAELR